MPFNNYAPQYIFKGQVQSDTAPSANNAHTALAKGLSDNSHLAPRSSRSATSDGARTTARLGHLASPNDHETAQASVLGSARSRQQSHAI